MPVLMDSGFQNNMREGNRMPLKLQPKAPTMHLGSSRMSMGKRGQNLGSSLERIQVHRTS